DINNTPPTIAAGKVITPSSFNWYYFIFTVYGLGVGAFSFRLIKLLYKLRRFIQNHQAIENYLAADVKIIETQGQLPTFSFLHYIFWDNHQDLNALEKEQILQHEMVHVQQKHSYDVLFLEVLRIIFWFNPLLYLYKKALTTTHEYLADAQVLRSVNQPAYAALLVKQVLNKIDFPIGNFFHKSLTSKRLQMIMKKDYRSTKIKPFLAVPVLVLIICFLSYCKVPVDEIIPNPVKLAAASPLNQAAEVTNDTGLVAPQFPGGEKAMYDYFLTELKFKPSYLKDSKVIGTAIPIKLDAAGNYEKIQEHDSQFPEFHRELNRVINKMPPWQPARRNGQSIPATYVLSIAYIDEASPSRINPDPSKQKTTFDPQGNPGFSSDFIMISTERPRTAEELVLAEESGKKLETDIDADVVFTFVEQPASFPGGETAMQQFIKENLHYPAEAKANKISGVVILKFVVDKAGKTKDFKVVKDLGYGTVTEALRLANLFPDFTPAKQNGKLVVSEYILPIRFDL
ncbi:MAG: hypothetical protein COW65_06270, partial [Cytophagales bacterium CG18_big_fil_WC_8_21_14_2_50_42_9]